MTIIITLSFAGNETGPFDLYSDATGFAIPFAQNVSKAALLAGYQVEAPDGTTVVRLDNLNSLCGSTDIYSCATPNCDFTGSIICDVTTTTTTTPPPTTTTTTSLPPATLCTWTSFGGDSGEIGVYDMINNTVSAVLVPNDFTVTQGVTRPICATQTKLWLSGETDETSLNFVVKEYNINSTSNPPTLSFVREINVSLANISESNLTFTGIQCTTITAINDTTLVVGFGGPTATNTCPTVVGYNIDISDTGNIALSLPSSSSDKIGLGAAVNTCNGTVSNPGVLHLNNGQVITNFRLDYDNPGDTRTGNWIQQKTLDSGPNQENITAPMKLQDLGVPEFTSAYTGEKYMDIFSREGILYVLHPETLVLYTVEQQPPYTAAADFTVTSDAPSVFSTTGCSDVDLYYEDPCDDVIVLPWLNVREESGASGPYIGPVSFDYQGMTVEGSSISATSPPTGFTLYPSYTLDYVGPYTGLVIPRANGVGLSGPSGQPFDYTITFPQPVNNIAIRVGILNTTFSNGEFIQGDIYQADTNTETPTITISTGYGVNVVGNQFGGGVYSDNSTNGEFIISCETDYTVLTISGTAPTGGPIALACTQPPLTCNLIYPEAYVNSCAANPGACYPGQAGYNRIYAWNPVSFIKEEIVLPQGSYMSYPDFSVSENYLIGNLLQTGLPGNLTRYGYTLGTNGVPGNITWDGVFYTFPNEWTNPAPGVMETINDTKFVALYQTSSINKVLEVEIIEGTTELQVTEKWENTDFRLTGDVLLTFKEDGVTPNKLISPSLPFGSFPDTGNLKQFDYLTGALEGTINLPTGIKGTASIGMVDNYIYISVRPDLIIDPSLDGLWRLDVNTSVWSLVPSEEAPSGITPGGAADFGSRAECRISDGIRSFDPPPSTTTTTTTLLEGVNTIWTWFEAETPA